MFLVFLPASLLTNASVNVSLFSAFFPLKRNTLTVQKVGNLDHQDGPLPLSTTNFPHPSPPPTTVTLHNGLIRSLPTLEFDLLALSLECLNCVPLPNFLEYLRIGFGRKFKLVVAGDRRQKPMRIGVGRNRLSLGWSRVQERPGHPSSQGGKGLLYVTLLFFFC